MNIVGTDGDSQHLCVLSCGGADQDPCGLPGARYHEVGTGGCRGNGGTLDKVNSRSATGVNHAACESECDGDANCVGYAVHDLNNECILYGPTQAGTCTTDATITTEETCGTCSADGWTAQSCSSAGGSWTTGWVRPDTSSIPWVGDSHATTHIHSSAATQGAALPPTPPPPPPTPHPTPTPSSSPLFARR